MKGSIRRRSKGSWEITIDMGRDAQGKRQRKFVNVKGKKADAELRLRKLLDSYDKGLHLDGGKITVGEFLKRWLVDYAIPNTRPRTSQRYESDIRLHITPAFGHVKLTQLGPLDIQNLEARMLSEGRAPRSVRHLHTVLKASLKHAMRWGLVHQNVAEAVDPPKVSPREINPPDVDEVWRILNLAKDTPYGPMIEFMARTGCRRGECLGLRWSNVDFVNPTASITQTLQRIARQGLVMQPPKTAKSRRALALDNQTIAMLREHQGNQVLAKMELNGAYADHGLVFPNATGKPLDPATLTRNFQRLTRKAELPGVRLHDLRHFHASVLLKSGTHLKVVQERLGHASIAITADTYSHVAPSLQQAAAAAFSDVMDQGSQ